MRNLYFDQQFCIKINYFSLIQCIILSDLYRGQLDQPWMVFAFESHIIGREYDSESRMIQVSTIVVSLYHSESSDESNR